MIDAVLYAPAVAAPAAVRTCAHCGETLRGAPDTPFCCPGCASAHAIIGAAGLGAFYRRLEQTRARRPEPLDIDFATYAKPDGHGGTSLELLVEGLDCAACVWLIESLLARNPTVTRARVHLSTRRLSLAWKGTVDEANGHAGLVAALGFRLAPYDTIAAAAGDDRESRELLRALGVAGFAAANVMLLSVAVWAGHDGSMGEATRTLFHWLSAAIALPAVAYAGRPFFRSALNALRAGRTNMDVPISIGVLLTLAVSFSETILGGRDAYFDAAVSLLFLLLIGRWLEHRLRARARCCASRGHSACCGKRSARYSAMASVSHTAKSPSVSTGTLPAGAMPPRRRLKSESPENESKRSCTSSNAMPACLSSTQGRMDQDE